MRERGGSSPPNKRGVCVDFSGAAWASAPHASLPMLVERPPWGCPTRMERPRSLPCPHPPSPILTQLQQGGLQHTPAPLLGESPLKGFGLEIRGSLGVLWGDVKVEELPQ